MEALYSGDEITNASFANSLLRNSIAPLGTVPFTSTSWLNEGHSNSCMLAKSTVTPLCSIIFLASLAKREFNDSVLNEAEKINTRNDSRPFFGFLSSISVKFYFVYLLKDFDANASHHRGIYTNSREHATVEDDHYAGQFRVK